MEDTVSMLVAEVAACISLRPCGGRKRRMAGKETHNGKIDARCVGRGNDARNAMRECMAVWVGGRNTG